MSETKYIGDEVFGPDFWINNDVTNIAVNCKVDISLDVESDVGDIVILVTSFWWWLIWDVGGRIIMLATFFVIKVIFSMY